jgi:hypothetical protein
MPSFEFSRQEGENLAQKLASFHAELSEREWALLLAVFSAARDNVEVVALAAGPGPTEPTLEDLREQIINAFIPGNDIVVSVNIRIGHLTPPPPPPPPTPTSEPRLDPATPDAPPAQP